MSLPSSLQRIVAAQPYPLLFATISGAHLYGFPSPDSDYDLRGVHLLPLSSVVGLEPHDETVQDSRVIDGLDRPDAYRRGERQPDGIERDRLTPLDHRSHPTQAIRGGCPARRGRDRFSSTGIRTPESPAPGRP